MFLGVSALILYEIIAENYCKPGLPIQASDAKIWQERVKT